MSDQPTIDSDAGVPVTLGEVMDQLDAEGRTRFQLAVARAQVAKLQAQQADSSPDAPSETP